MLQVVGSCIMRLERLGVNSMPAINPEVLDDDIRELFEQTLEEAGGDPIVAMAMAWNLSWDVAEGLKVC